MKPHPSLARPLLATAALLASLPSSSPLAAEASPSILPDWRLSGSNTARASWYDAAGLASAGPYPFEGPMAFDEFNLYFDQRRSRYDLIRGEVSGVVNADDGYRSSFNGMVPERLNFTRENGEGGLPYRLEVGDYFAYYSYLTLQRSLKGVQLELQPVTDAAGRRHSIIITSGADEPDWRGLTLKDDYSNGISWLIQDPEQGSLNLNLVYNHRDGASSKSTLDRDQYVFSIAAEKAFALWRQNLNLEVEGARFIGDHNGLSGAASGRSKHDTGLFAELTGFDRSMPLDYRLRYERYGQNFRPRGAVVTPDRASYEAHAGWRFTNGLRARARVQVFDDALETANTLRTRTYGLNLSGPMLQALWRGVSGTVDAYLQNRNSDTGSTDTLSQTLNASLSKSLPHDWNGRAAWFYQHLNDQTATNADRLTNQLSISADHPIRIGGFEGLITPGVNLRTLRNGGNYSNDVTPSLALSLHRGPHALRVDYASQIQHRRLALSGPDIDTHTLNLDYRYTRGASVFGIEANAFNRNPDPGQHTNAYRVSLTWTYNFDRPPLRLARAARPPAPSPGPGVTIRIDPYALAPGLPRAAVMRALATAGISGASRQGAYLVYEYPLFNRILKRQRLGLRFMAGSLADSVLIIDFDDVGDRDSVKQTYERVRQELLRRYGPATRTYEQGRFTAGFVDDVNRQRLIRLVEWETPSGILRFGIPRRLDGQVRMEIRHARRLPRPGETLWSVEAIR